jgi:hypothetical protein
VIFLTVMRTRFLAPAILAFATPIVFAASAPMVPANFSPQADSAGFNWTIDSNGSVDTGSGLLNNSFYLEVNNNSFSAQQPMMTADGSEYFLASSNGNSATVMRRVKIDQKNALVRYIDTITSTSPAPQTLNIRLRIQFNNQMQSVLTDRGAVLAASLGPGETGFVATSPQMPTSALFMLGSSRTKIRPTIQNQSNAQFMVTYSVPVAPGESISLLYVVAQRNLAGATDAKTLAKLFAPLKSPRVAADLGAAERKTLVNFHAGTFLDASSLPSLASLMDSLQVQPGTQDVLAIGADTRLKGTASCASLTITTPRGKADVPLEKVAALIGGSRSGRIIFRDGQALSGKLSASGLKFTLTTGTTVDLDISALDRLVLREKAGDKASAHSAWAMVDTFEGDRLAVNPTSDLRLHATTSWGACDISADDLVAYGPTEENPLAFTVLLRDGSRFVALLDGDEITLDTALFGKKTFRTSEIRQVGIVQSAPADDDESADLAPARAQVMLAGNQVITGQIDLPELHFLSPTGIIPVTPNLLHRLTNTSDDSETPTFNAEIWGGGTVSGSLRELIIPVRAGKTTFQVPVRDIVSAVVPSPQIPPELRDKVAGLIRDLGDPDWEKRESASRELGGLGAMTRDQLEEAVKQTPDAEVRRRAQALIDDLEAL